MTWRRLGFAATVIVWEEPMLGIFYPWAAAHLTNWRRRASPPLAPRLVLALIARRLRHGGGVSSPAVFPELTEVAFRLGARAQNDRGWAGRWERPASGRHADARGFVLEVEKKERTARATPTRWADAHQAAAHGLGTGAVGGAPGQAASAVQGADSARGDPGGRRLEQPEVLGFRPGTPGGGSAGELFP